MSKKVRLKTRKQLESEGWVFDDDRASKDDLYIDKKEYVLLGKTVDFEDDDWGIFYFRSGRFDPPKAAIATKKDIINQFFNEKETNKAGG